MSVRYSYNNGVTFMNSCSCIPPVLPFWLGSWWYAIAVVLTSVNPLRVALSSVVCCTVAGVWRIMIRQCGSDVGTVLSHRVFCFYLLAAVPHSRNSITITEEPRNIS